MKYPYLLFTVGFASLSLYWMVKYLNHGMKVHLFLGILSSLFMVLSLLLLCQAIGW